MLFLAAVITSQSGVRDIETTPDNIIVSGHIDGNVRLWDIKTGNLIYDISGVHTRSITSVSRSIDGSILVASSDCSMSLLDIRNFQVIRKFSDKNFISTGRACLSPDGQFAARGSDKGEVLLWRIASGEVVHRFKPRSIHAIKAIDWSINGLLATCDANGCLVVRSHTK